MKYIDSHIYIIPKLFALSLENLVIPSYLHAVIIDCFFSQVHTNRFGVVSKVLLFQRLTFA